MKFTLPPSVAFAGCAAALLLCSGLVRAADDDLADCRTESEALLHAMHTEQVLTNATNRVYQMVDKYSQCTSSQGDLTPEQKAAAQNALQEAHLVIGNQLSWDAIKNDFIQAYAEAFTLDELKTLNTFYSSPVGQKLVEKQPGVTEKMGRLTQQKMMAVMPAIMQKIKEATQKTPSAPPAPAAAAPGPVIPATPPPVATPTP